MVLDGVDLPSLPSFSIRRGLLAAVGSVELVLRSVVEPQSYIVELVFIPVIGSTLIGFNYIDGMIVPVLTYILAGLVIWSSIPLVSPEEMEDWTESIDVRIITVLSAMSLFLFFHASVEYQLLVYFPESIAIVIFVIVFVYVFLSLAIISFYLVSFSRFNYVDPPRGLAVFLVKYHMDYDSSEDPLCHYSDLRSKAERICGRRLFRMYVLFVAAVVLLGQGGFLGFAVLLCSYLFPLLEFISIFLALEIWADKRIIPSRSIRMFPDIESKFYDSLSDLLKQDDDSIFSMIAMGMGFLLSVLLYMAIPFLYQTQGLSSVIIYFSMPTAFLAYWYSLFRDVNNSIRTWGSDNQPTITNRIVSLFPPVSLWIFIQHYRYFSSITFLVIFLVLWFASIYSIYRAIKIRSPYTRMDILISFLIQTLSFAIPFYFYSEVAVPFLLLILFVSQIHLTSFLPTTYIDPFMDDNIDEWYHLTIYELATILIFYIIIYLPFVDTSLGRETSYIMMGVWAFMGLFRPDLVLYFLRSDS